MSGVRVRAAEREGQLLRILTARAAANEPCPTNGELCDLLGMDSVGATSGVVSRLERRGLIRVERGSISRVVTIVSTGQRTAGEVGKPHWRLSRSPSPRKPRSAPVKTVEQEETFDGVRVDRDPCPRCGVRADIGCGHSHAPLGMVL